MSEQDIQQPVEGVEQGAVEGESAAAEAGAHAPSAQADGHAGPDLPAALPTMDDMVVGGVVVETTQPGDASRTFAPAPGLDPNDESEQPAATGPQEPPNTPPDAQAAAPGEQAQDGAQAAGEAVQGDVAEAGLSAEEQARLRRAGPKERRQFAAEQG